VKILTIILAGGTGRELSVLTEHRAKTALPFGGRYRIIDFCLSNCVHSGMADIAVLAQHSPKSLLEHIGMGKPWDLDRKAGGIYILQPTYDGKATKWYQGTADALFQNMDLILNSDADTILVLSGDQVYKMDYGKLVHYHREKGRLVTLVCKAVPSDQVSRFGIVECSKAGEIISFREKPKKERKGMASLGIYVFNKDFLVETFERDKIDLVFDVIIPLLKDRLVSGYGYDLYWEDIGSVKSYYRASLRLINSRETIADPNWPIYTREEGLPPTKIMDGARVDESLVASGCRIEGRVRRSVIFPGVVVEKGANVEESVVFSHSRIRNNAIVRRSIVDKLVNIGREAVVGRKGKAEVNISSGILWGASETSGITVIGKGAVIDGKTGIPAGCVVKPYSRIKKEG
jgi:glucose-1-phosphate adenylyltransferase